MGRFKFEIGDRVKILDGSNIDGYTGGWVEAMRELCGDIGIVKSCGKTSTGKHYYTLSSDNSKIQSWILFDERGLKRANEERKIVITTDGTMTRAALYDGHKLIREAKAICSKDDTFDFETGAKTAFERLTAKPKKELKPLNTKIFVLDGDEMLKSSHIYEIKNGKILMGVGIYPCRGTLYTMSDVINYLKPPHLRSGDEKFDSKGEIFSTFNSLEQITVMEVKEG